MTVTYYIRSWNGFDTHPLAAEQVGQSNKQHGDANHCRYSLTVTAPRREYKPAAHAVGIDEARKAFIKLRSEGATGLHIERQSCGSW